MFINFKFNINDKVRVIIYEQLVEGIIAEKIYYNNGEREIIAYHVKVFEEGYNFTQEDLEQWNDELIELRRD